LAGVYVFYDVNNVYVLYVFYFFYVSYFFYVFYVIEVFYVERCRLSNYPYQSN